MKLFPFIKSLNANGVVIEWEDMFPYTGKLASARNGNAYSMDAVTFSLSQVLTNIN